MSIDIGMNNEAQRHIKKDGTIPLSATWMDLETIRRSEASQRKTHTMVSLIRRI